MITCDTNGCEYPLHVRWYATLSSLGQKLNYTKIVLRLQKLGRKKIERKTQLIRKR